MLLEKKSHHDNQTVNEGRKKRGGMEMEAWRTFEAEVKLRKVRRDELVLCRLSIACGLGGGKEKKAEENSCRRR